MRAVFASAVVASVVVVSLNGCASAFSPGSLDWGHGATPRAVGTTTVQAGIGAGAGYGLVSDASFGGNALGPIAGAGGGVGVEHQASEEFLMRAEAGGGCQNSIVQGGVPVCPVAAYLGGQLNPKTADTGEGNDFAVRGLVGGGADLLVTGGAETLVLPYAAAAGGAVFSHEDGGFEQYLDVHVGLKLGLVTATPVGNFGATGGLRYDLNDLVSVYGALRADALFIATTPALTGSLQGGALLRF